MKLLIQDKLFLRLTEKEDVEYVVNLLKQNSVFHTVKTEDLCYVVEILTQKVTLDEITMNTLFYEVLCFTEHKLGYGHLGGRGCDFCLELTNKDAN